MPKFHGNALEIFRNLIIPGGTALVIATAAYVRLSLQIEESAGAIDQIRESILRSWTLGNHGLLDSTFHGILDSQIKHWHEETFGRSGFRKLEEQHSTARNGDRDGD